MGRKPKPDPLDQARRLASVRTMIDDMSDALPGAARELRRSAKETLDDVIAELARPSLQEFAVRRKQESHGL